MASRTQSLGAATYDFIFKGGLKKTVLAVALGSFLLISVSYIAFPQTAASVALSATGTGGQQDFTPPEIEDGEQVFEYKGTFSGSAGPVGTRVEGEIHATVDFEEGKVVAKVSGDKVKEGYFEGELDPETGELEGEGAVNVFGMAGEPVEFEGQADPEAVEASGSWVGVGEVGGKGGWQAEMTEESRRKAGLTEDG